MKTFPLDPTNSRLTRVRLFFDQTSDEKLFVLSELLSAGEPAMPSHLSVHTFPHEDRFLERLIAADLPVDDTSLMAATVIRVASQSEKIQSWIELTLTQEQMAALGLNGERLYTHHEWTSNGVDPLAESAPFHFADNSSQFYQFLMQSSTPFVMLSGPEHRFTFINQPYVDLIGKTSMQEILMKPVREVLPELEGQPFFTWLDEVYKTGVKRIGKEQLAHIRRQRSEGFEDRYFDFLYYPVRNTEGKIYGVMVQAADVTDKVRWRRSANTANRRCSGNGRS